MSCLTSDRESVRNGAKNNDLLQEERQNHLNKRLTCVQWIDNVKRRGRRPRVQISELLKHRRHALPHANTHGRHT
jgi:hypothetical protein